MSQNDMMLILNVLKVSQDWDGANTFTLQIPRFYIFHHFHYDPLIHMMVTLTVDHCRLHHHLQSS